jgi:hypothetical protein
MDAEGRARFSPPHKARPFWHKHAGTPIGRRYMAPGTWDELSAPLRLLYFHRAVVANGIGRGFTLRLRHDIEAQAREQRHPLDWLYRRVARELKARIGSSPLFWLVLEVDKKRQLHVHGEIAIDRQSAKKAAKALRCAGGEWLEDRQFQVKWKPSLKGGKQPDEGWVTYLSKNAWKLGPLLRQTLKQSSTLGPPQNFDGPWFAAPNDLRNQARRLYVEAREGFIADRRFATALSAGYLKISVGT